MAAPGRLIATTAPAWVRPWRPGRTILVLGALALLLLATAVVALSIGVEPISPLSIVGMATQWLPVHPARTWSDLDLTIVTQVRLTRIVTALAVGAALGMAGTAYQALFRNPLADPGIVGTSAGASVGAILAFVAPFQLSVLGFGLVPVAAFTGALLATLLVYTLARVGSRAPSTTLLLAGFAVSAVLNAVSALVETLSDQLRVMYSWLLGSVAVNTDEQLLVACPLILVGGIGLLAFSGDLNVLLLGDEHAGYLGLHVTRRRLAILALGALLTSVSVALGGVIALVGLLVPHITRLLVGADHRLLLPASALMGGIFLIVVDTVARTVISPEELPVGLITALVGAPAFIFLLRRKKSAYVV